MAEKKGKKKTDSKYSEKAQEKIAETMKEFKEGKLTSGSGEKVTDRDQALAIAISQARSKGYKVPKEKKEKGEKSGR